MTSVNNKALITGDVQRIQRHYVINICQGRLQTKDSCKMIINDRCHATM